MKRVLMVLALLMALSAVLAPAYADDAIKVSANTFKSNFPSTLEFQLDAQSSAKITQVSLVAQVGDCVSNRYVPDFTPDTTVHATYQWKVPQNYLPPGAMGQYWWTIQDSAGNQLQTPKQAFRVDDPTQKWQQLSNDKLALYWYAGSSSYGQALFDRSNEAMNFLVQYTGATVDRPVQIFIYGDHNSFVNALDPRTVQGWEGGVTLPEYGVVLIEAEDAE